MHLFKPVCSFLLLLLCLVPAFALDPHKLITQYDIRVYTTRDGLPMNSVKKVFQDSRGYIWVGTQEGLVRFDGARFKLYDKSRNPGLRSNFIRDIVEDHAGNLWLATSGGGISRLEGEAFVTYTTEEGLAHNTVNTLLVAQDGSLVIGTEYGLSRFTEGRFATSHLTDNADAQNIQALTQDSSGALYIGRYGFPLTRIAWEDLVPDFTPPKSAMVYCRVPLSEMTSPLFYDDLSFMAFSITRRGEILAGNSSSFLGCITPRSGSELSMLWLPDFQRDRVNLRALIEDRDGVIWLCSEGRGIVRWHRGRSSRFDTENGLPVSGNDFWTIMEDREGSIWIGGDGLLRVRDNTFTPWGRPERLPGDYGHSICADAAGTVCAGFKTGGVALIRDLQVEKYFPRWDLPDGPLTVVLPAREGGFWIGYTGGAVFRISSSSEAVQYATSFSSGNPALRVLLEDSHGRLWRGMGGLLSCKEGGVWRDHGFDRRMTPHSEVTAMIELAPDDFWFGTFGDGLHRFTRGRFHQEGILPELHSDGITLLYRDQEGVLWIGSDNQGLYSYADGRFTRYTEQEGLFASRIFAILEDDSSNFWCSCNKGVFRVARSAFADFSAGRIGKITCRVYGQLDGMREAECNGRRQPSGWKGPDGRLWFTSIAGFISVDPNHLPHNAVPPPVCIETIRSGDSLYACGSGSIRLAARERDLHFSYTGLSFAVPERVRFRIKLDGYDKEWNDAGSRREAVYTNLPRGKFTFRVMACNNDGIWNQAGAAQPFIIPPFWYETWWAYGGYFLFGIAGVGWTARKWYRRQFLKQQLELKTEHAAKLEDLNRARSRFFAGISHEFRTPLTLIAAPLEDLVQQKGNGRNAPFAMMLRNTRRLQGLVDQLLDLAQAQSGKMTLRAQPVEIMAFLRALVASFESLAKRRRIRLSLAAVPDGANLHSSLVLWVDPDKMEKVIANLLDNGLKYTPKGGRVSVNLSTAQGPDRLMARIEVTDTGAGIPEAVQPHLFDYFYRYRDENRNSVEGTGIGLGLCREIVLLHHGEIKLLSREGEGSTFIIILPVGKQHLRPEEISGGAPVTDFGFLPRSGGDPETNAALTLPEGQTGKAEPTRSTVLLVEDNGDMRDLLRRFLMDKYTILEAKDGREGLRKALIELPDLVLSDVMMPGMDGYALCRALREDPRTSHIPVLLLTARGGRKDRFKGLDLGAADYLTKPFDRRELDLRIRNLLWMQEQLKERVRQQLANLGGPKPGHMVTPADEKFLEQAATLVRDHGGESGFAAHTLARLMGISRAHLNRKLHALTGLKSNLFIRTLRLQHASELLRRRTGSVSEIAFAVGFNHLSYFAACFKEQYGCPPSEYMQDSAM
jgi:signal transduction histidine kinase/ligand-binding sensor domain-containing protein/DNA-binding NarL/FixJ family response regulator